MSEVDRTLAEKTAWANIAKATVDAAVGALTHLWQRNEGSYYRLVKVFRSGGGRVVVTGLGKSGIIAQKIAATLASTGTRAAYLNAAEALHGDLGIVDPGDIVIMLSNSAATIELAGMWPTLSRIGVTTVGFFGNTRTHLAQKVDILFDLSVQGEGCPLNLAPMASTTLALAAGDVLASVLMHASGFTPADFALYHPGGLLGRKLLHSAADVMHTGEQLPKVHEKASVREIVIELTRTRLGAVGVVDDAENLVGIITDGDLRRLMLSRPSLDSYAAEFMTREFTGVEQDWLLGRVIEIMEDPNKLISVVPVMHQGRYCGMIRLHDILR